MHRRRAAHSIAGTREDNLFADTGVIQQPEYNAHSCDGTRKHIYIAGTTAALGKR
jgi:hypothetical protein